QWTNAGTYRLIVSNPWGSFTNDAIILTVLRSPLEFDPTALHMTSGGLNLRLLGASGLGPVIVEASSNLITWVPILTNPPIIGSFEFIDPTGSTASRRFYRALQGSL